MTISRHGPRKCRVCRGAECKGGGFLKCAQRDPRPSILFGVIDAYGGIRHVVAHEDEVRHHCRFDELAYIVPKLTVHEPIAWNDIPFVVERIRLEIDKWLDRRPNLNEQDSRIIQMYRIRQQRNPNRTIDLNEVVWA